MAVGLISFRAPDKVWGKVLAETPWERGQTTDPVARKAGIGEDLARAALDDLVRRGTVTIDETSYRQ
jgi:ribosomal protein S18 acetylase RimI-like enzyme